MSILGLIVSLVMFVIAMIIVARPLLRPSRTHLEIETNIERQRDRLRIYYERVLTNIRDLDEDYNTGKIGEADYREEREVWVHRGIRLLRVQDSLDAKHSLVSPADAAEEIDRAIETAISAYREGAQPAFRDLTLDEASAP